MIDDALRIGRRGLERGGTLARLLKLHRGARTYKAKAPPLDEGLILSYADAYRARTGRWPVHTSGRIEGGGGTTWAAVEQALRGGLRGLAGGRSLAGLLAAERGMRNRARLPPLRIARILEWADAHRERTGQ